FSRIIWDCYLGHGENRKPANVGLAWKGQRIVKSKPVERCDGPGQRLLNRRAFLRKGLRLCLIPSLSINYWAGRSSKITGFQRGMAALRFARVSQAQSGYRWSIK